MTDAPIGIFDLGFGGFTVVWVVMDQLFYEAVVYFGDIARQFYGLKPIGEVREYVFECFDHLVEQGVKVFVIVCNSVSAVMLCDVWECYDVFVVEVILFAICRAVVATCSGHIGVICICVTVQSLAYEDVFVAAPHIDLMMQVCFWFVDFVEQGVISGSEFQAVVYEYFDLLIAAGVDTLIFGCIYYLLLIGVIFYVMGDEVILVSSAEECAKDVYWMLVQHGLECEAGDPFVYWFFIMGQPEEFVTHGRRFLGFELEVVTQFVGGAWVIFV